MIKLVFFVILILQQDLRSWQKEGLIDLSWEFDNNTVYVSGLKEFGFTKSSASLEERGYWYAVNEFCAAEHGGTHFDAPYHFYQQGLKVSEIDVSKLFAKGALLNLTRDAEELGRNVRLTVKHLEDWQSRNGPFESGTVLLVDFGRSKLWLNRSEYLDLEGEALNFPGLSKEAAEWIVDSGKFYGIGLDTPSIDPGNTTDYFAHTHLAKHDLYNLENLKLLDPLPEKGFELIVAPMKIEDGTGAPLRLYARINN